MPFKSCIALLSSRARTSTVQVIPTTKKGSASPFIRKQQQYEQKQQQQQPQKQSIRRRYPILSSMSTQYTINDEVCSPVDEGELRKIVQKHCRTLDSFLQNRPIAAHTKAAFDQIYHKVDPNRKLILDSGCGTGRSTLLLGEKFPDHTVIGVDRSFVRLNRNSLLQNHDNGINNENDIDNTDGVLIETNDDTTDSDETQHNNVSMHNSNNAHSQRPFQAIGGNVLLVRAELTDFWRCCLQANWDISHHYILYPNPYPKKNRIKKRFYAHPSFPLILKLGGEIVIRSNWEGYLKEFSQSVVHAHEYYKESEDADVTTDNFALPYYENALSGPKERTDKAIAWTNFEKKYDDVGEKTYELIL